MINHAHADSNFEILESIPKANSTNLLTLAFTLLVKQGSVVIPWDVNGKQMSVGLGTERAAVYGAIVVELGKRIDHVQ